MSRRLVISALPGERRLAWLEAGEAVDLFVERRDRPQITGSLYLGRVVSLDRGLEAAFVEIGLPQPGFLPFGEAPRNAVGKLSEGDSLIVRVLRGPREDKGARLTARLTASPAGLAERTRRLKPPALLVEGGDALPALLARNPDEILCDDSRLCAEIAGLRSRQAESAPRSLTHYNAAEPLLQHEGLDEVIEGALDPQVALPSGGRLLIEPVRTLTAIDVDSKGHGHGLSRSGQELQAQQVNDEAVAVLARQLRLRALSGLIVVDFLAPENAAGRKRIVTALKVQLKKDPENALVSGMSPSGLLEMTRRRSRAPLHELLLMPCGRGGWVRDPVALAFEALRALRGMALTDPAGRAGLRAAPAICEAFAGPAAAAKASVEAAIGYTVRTQADSAIPEYSFE